MLHSEEGNEDLPSRSEDEYQSQRDISISRGKDNEGKDRNREGGATRKKGEGKENGGREGGGGEGRGGEGRGEGGREAISVGHGRASKSDKTTGDLVRNGDLKGLEDSSKQQNQPIKDIQVTKEDDLNSWAQGDINDLLDDPDSSAWEVKGRLRLQEYDFKKGGTREVILTKEMELEILGDEEDITCGVGCLRGGLLQRFARPEVYLLAFSMVALSKGVYYAYSTATISTVERRFKFTSKVSGIISTGNDVAQILLSVHVSYLAGHGHRPRWIAMGMTFAILACFMVALPHWFFGAGELSELATALNGEDVVDVSSRQQMEGGGITVCDGNDTSDNCNTFSISNEQYTVITLHFLGQVISGFASLVLDTVGYSYLDEAVPKDRAPLYFALTGCVRMLGPVCGYAMGGWALQMWVEPQNTPTITPTHPSWVGAWWLGYLVMGCAMLVPVFFLPFLPKILPGARQRTLENLQVAASKGVEEFENFKNSLRPRRRQNWKEMWPLLRRLGRNPIYLLLVAFKLVFWFTFAGYQMFKSKYMEHQFRMSAAAANQYVAAASMVASLVGWLGTGTVLTAFRPRAKWVLLYMAALSALNCALHLAQMSVTCPQPEVYGLKGVLERHLQEPQQETLRNNTSTSEASLLSLGSDLGECMTSCNCPARFSPVCVAGNYTFYSACHAGCSGAVKENGKLILSDCTCGELLTTDEGVPFTPGYCPGECPAFTQYLVISCLTKLLDTSSFVIVFLVFFRCVAEREKDLGIGVFNALLSLFAFVCAPILVGLAIDKSCLLWERSCGQRGFCHLYDLNAYRFILHGIPAGGMVVCCLIQVALVTKHHLLDLYGEGEELARRSIKERRADGGGREGGGCGGGGGGGGGEDGGAKG